MQIATIKKAVTEAREFIRRAEAVLKNETAESVYVYVWGSSKSGALRRQSVELTRILAQMRKP